MTDSVEHLRDACESGPTARIPHSIIASARRWERERILRATYERGGRVFVFGGAPTPRL
jgi:hypothetical protein